MGHTHTHTEKQGKGVGKTKKKAPTSSFRSDPSQECELEHLHFEGNLKHACKHTLSHKTTQAGAG